MPLRIASRFCSRKRRDEQTEPHWQNSIHSSLPSVRRAVSVCVRVHFRSSSEQITSDLTHSPDSPVTAPGVPDFVSVDNARRIAGHLMNLSCESVTSAVREHRALLICIATYFFVSSSQWCPSVPLTGHCC